MLPLTGDGLEGSRSKRRERETEGVRAPVKGVGRSRRHMRRARVLPSRRGREGARRKGVHAAACADARFGCRGTGCSTSAIRMSRVTGQSLMSCARFSSAGICADGTNPRHSQETTVLTFDPVRAATACWPPRAAMTSRASMPLHYGTVPQASSAISGTGRECRRRRLWHHA